MALFTLASRCSSTMSKALLFQKPSFLLCRQNHRARIFRAATADNTGSRTLHSSTRRGSGAMMLSSSLVMLAGPPSIATRTFAAAADHAEHPTYELAVDDSALVLMPCPGTKGADLQSSLEQLQGQGVQAILTLLSTEELEGKNVGTLGTIAEELGIKWFHLPISDDESPGEDFAAGWATASPILHDIMDNGGKVAVHCMGGSGRTGIGAAHLLLEKGWDLPKIIEQVQALRPGAFKKPDQIAYVESLAFQML